MASFDSWIVKIDLAVFAGCFYGIQMTKIRRKRSFFLFHPLAERPFDEFHDRFDSAGVLRIVFPGVLNWLGNVCRSCRI